MKPALVLTGAALFAAASGGANAQDAPGAGPGNVQVSDEGKEIFEQVCQACHMADAKGGGEPGARIPALANNPRLQEPNYGVIILLKGRGGMPWFTDLLTQAQMAAVLTYVRSHFNNYPDPITEADVKKLAVNPPPIPD